MVGGARSGLGPLTGRRIVRNVRNSEHLYELE
jgi:hypothetical protein